MNSSTEFIVHSPETYARAREEQQQRRRSNTSPVRLAALGQRRRSHPEASEGGSEPLRRKSDGDTSASGIDINSSVASVASVASAASFASVASSTPSRAHSPANASTANTSSNSSFEIVETTGRERARKRRRTTPSELEVLESEFVRNNKPCKEHRERIAERLGMEEKCVQIWFQNKRQSCRRQMSQADTSADSSSASADTSRNAFRTHSFPATQFTTVHLLPELQNPDRKPGLALPAIHQPVQPAQRQPSLKQAVVVRPDDDNMLAPVLEAPPKSDAASLHPSDKNNENAKGKSIRLTMSADGKAEVVVRSPLKPIYSQQRQFFAGAKRFASMPLLQPSRGEADAECARNLLLLRTGGQW